MEKLRNLPQKVPCYILDLLLILPFEQEMSFGRAQQIILSIKGKKKIKSFCQKDQLFYQLLPPTTICNMLVLAKMMFTVTVASVTCTTLKQQSCLNHKSTKQIKQSVLEICRHSHEHSQRMRSICGYTALMIKYLMSLYTIYFKGIYTHALCQLIKQIINQIPVVSSL